MNYHPTAVACMGHLAYLCVPAQVLTHVYSHIVLCSPCKVVPAPLQTALSARVIDHMASKRQAGAAESMRERALEGGRSQTGMGCRFVGQISAVMYCCTRPVNNCCLLVRDGGVVDQSLITIKVYHGNVHEVFEAFSSHLRKGASFF